MSILEIALCTLIGAAVIFILLIAIVRFFLDYTSAVRYVKMEIQRASEWKEYVYWKQELRDLRWSILPGLTPGRVKRIRRKFYHGKNSGKMQNDGLRSMLIPSVLGMMLCSVCLAASTWAWFSASVSTTPHRIQTATCDVTVSIDGVLADKTFTLTEGEHVVSLELVGTASTGYCKIILNNDLENPHYTPQLDITQKEKIEFTVKVDANTPITIIPSWGTYVADGKNIISSPPLSDTAAASSLHTS